MSEEWTRLDEETNTVVGRDANGDPIERKPTEQEAQQMRRWGDDK